MAKLFRISQAVNDNYETYNDAVVCAEDEGSAILIHPGGYKWNGRVWARGEDEEYQSPRGTWAEPSAVETKYVGEAASDIEVGSVICASFFAG